MHKPPVTRISRQTPGNFRCQLGQVRGQNPQGAEDFQLRGCGVMWRFLVPSSSFTQSGETDKVRSPHSKGLGRFDLPILPGIQLQAPWLAAFVFVPWLFPAIPNGGNPIRVSGAAVQIFRRHLKLKLLFVI
jgi:hypothetical protein